MGLQGLHADPIVTAGLVVPEFNGVVVGAGGQDGPGAFFAHHSIYP